MDAQTPRFPFDFLDQDARRLLWQLLSAVVDYPDNHENRMSVKQQRSGDYEYRVAQKSGRSPAISQDQRLKTNIFAPLTAKGWIVPNKAPGYQSGMQCFSPEAIDWYRANSGPTDHQIQEGIGQVLFSHFGSSKPSLGRDEIVAALKLPGDRVDRNLHIMTTLKYLSASGGLPISPWGKPEPPTAPTYVLTNDLGLSWANGGFRPIGTVLTPVVHISITINHFLEQVAQLPIDDDVKEDIRQTAEQLQGDPSWALFQQLMSFGANSLVVLPTVLNFLLENAKAINNFVEFHPLGV